MVTQKLYSFTKQQQELKNNAVKQLSMNGVLKPLSIGSVTNICNQDVQFLKAKINNQLTRIKNLEKNITFQLNNPKYLKVRTKNQLDLKILKRCEQIHRDYFNKILYYRNKTLNPNVVYINTIQQSYRMMLFELNQQYLKLKLQLRGVDANENPLRNLDQFQKIRV